MDFTAIDFETTGLDGDGRNEPWQLGAAIVRNSEIVETREWFFGTPLTPDFEPIMDQWDDFFPVISGTRLVAHNIACERTILTRLAPLTPWGPWTDTLKLAKKRCPYLASFRLGDVCEALGCVPEIEGRTWHDGLYDAVACAEIALRLDVG